MKKRLIKVFAESNSTHMIDIFDVTGTIHRQWPNRAWPAKCIYLLGLKNTRTYALADLKAMGVTPLESLEGGR